MSDNEEAKEYLRKIGAKGGKATAKKYGKRHMKELAKHSHVVRRQRREEAQ